MLERSLNIFTAQAFFCFYYVYLKFYQSFRFDIFWAYVSTSVNKSEKSELCGVCFSEIK